MAGTPDTPAIDAQRREPLLADLGTSRFSLLPIKHECCWKHFKKHQAAIWTTEECDFSSDKDDFLKMSDSERTFVLMVLQFFQASDILVNECGVMTFCQEIEIPEVRCFYGVQQYMENVHTETYARMLEQLCTPAEQERAFNAITYVPSIRRKHEWAVSYADPAVTPLASRLVCFATFEGVLFSASFAAIYFFKGRNLMPGLTFSNELIARDEGLHTDFACHLYRDHIEHKLTDAEAHAIVGGGVEAELQFVDESLRSDVIGLGKDRMRRYVKHCANRLLVSLGHAELYTAAGEAESLPFMDALSVDGSVNFFEKRNSSYSKKPSTAADIDFSDEF